MDSLDFLRRVWPEDRDDADARLEAAMAWIGMYALPERVFTLAQLDHWAHQNGYTTSVDTKQIAALLRSLSPLVERTGELRDRLTDALHAYG